MWKAGRIMTAAASALLVLAIFLPWAHELGIHVAYKALDHAGGHGDATPFILAFVLVSIGALGGLISLVGALTNKVWLSRIFILVPLLTWIAAFIYLLAETGDFQLFGHLDVGHNIGMFLTWVMLVLGMVVSFIWKK